MFVRPATHSAVHRSHFTNTVHIVHLQHRSTVRVATPKTGQCLPFLFRCAGLYAGAGTATSSEAAATRMAFSMRDARGYICFVRAACGSCLSHESCSASTSPTVPSPPAVRRESDAQLIGVRGSEERLWSWPAVSWANRPGLDTFDIVRAFEPARRTLGPLANGGGGKLYARTRRD